MELLSQIQPRSINEFCGNRLLIKNLKTALSRSCVDKNMFVILGPDGSGKTILSNILFAEIDVQVLEISKLNLNNDEMKNTLHNFANNKTIESFICKKSKLIFLDDVDILLNSDKTILSKLLAVNKAVKSKGIKIVFTCNVNEEKKILDHTKDMEIFRLSYPPVKDSFAYLSFQLDNIEYDYSQEMLLLLCQKFKGNIREVVLNLGNTKYNVTQTSAERMFKDMNTFDITKCILSGKYTLSDLRHFTQSDTGMVPYVMYENLPDEIHINYKLNNKTSLVEMYSKVNDVFIAASKMEDTAFKQLEWGLIQYANILKIGIIIYVLLNIQRKQVQKDITYRFSQVMSKMSHKNMVAKKIKAISSNTNFSKTSIITATDMKTQKAVVNESLSTLSNTKLLGMMTIKNVDQECTSISNTYEKYFT